MFNVRISARIYLDNINFTDTYLEYVCCKFEMRMEPNASIIDTKINTISTLDEF